VTANTRRHPALRPGWIDRPHEALPLGDFVLESGVVVENAHLSYVTHGTLNAARDNAVLLQSAIGTTHHRLDFLIGAGKAFDPTRHFIICADALGNGMSISPSNSQTQPGMLFPRFAIRDMVESQMRLLDALGIERLHAVSGASMGGMQAVQWGVSHPGRMRKIVAMTPMAQTQPWPQVVMALSRQMLLADPAWDGERFTAVPKQGFAQWAGVVRILANRTPEAVRRAMPAGISAHTMIAELGRDSAESGPDPVDWIYQTWAYDAHDVASTPGAGGTAESALGRVTAQALVLAPPLDLLNPAEEARRTAALMPRGRFVEIPSVEGHQAASGVDPADTAFLDRTIAAFLAAD
jgi:homoserine O-acetyltransferase